MCSVHIQLGVLHVSVDPRTGQDSKFNPFQLSLINVFGFTMLGDTKFLSALFISVLDGVDLHL